MLYVASVVDKETKKLQIMTMEYPTKKAFKSDLVGNGYSVRFIATEETFDEECEKYHERVERQKYINRAMWESDSKIAKKLGMTTMAYRRQCKADKALVEAWKNITD